MVRTNLAGLYCGGADLCLDKNLIRSLHAALLAVELTSHIPDSLPQLYWNSGLLNTTISAIYAAPLQLKSKLTYKFARSGGFSSVGLVQRHVGSLLPSMLLCSVAISFLDYPTVAWAYNQKLWSE